MDNNSKQRKLSKLAESLWSHSFIQLTNICLILFIDVLLGPSLPNWCKSNSHPRNMGDGWIQHNGHWTDGTDNGMLISYNPSCGGLNLWSSWVGMPSWIESVWFWARKIHLRLIGRMRSFRFYQMARQLTILSLSLRSYYTMGQALSWVPSRARQELVLPAPMSLKI